jgi:hypothetical protein
MMPWNMTRQGREKYGLLKTGSRADFDTGARKIKNAEHPGKSRNQMERRAISREEKNIRC